MSFIDEEKAWAVAWDEVPEPIQIVMKRDGTIYCEGQVQSDMHVNFGDDLATLSDGTPCIVVEPVPGGYRPTDYTEESINEYREQRFEAALKEIRTRKWDAWRAKQAGMSVEEYRKQKYEQGIANPTATVAMITLEPPSRLECHMKWVQDLIGRYALNQFSREQFRCICRQQSCPHWRS